MVAPWTEPVAAADPQAEAAVRAWLEAGAAPRPGIVLHDGRPDASLLDVDAVEVDEYLHDRIDPSPGPADRLGDPARDREDAG